MTWSTCIQKPSAILDRGVSSAARKSKPEGNPEPVLYRPSEIFIEEKDTAIPSQKFLVRDSL